MRRILRVAALACAVGALGWAWGPALAGSDRPLQSIAPGSDLELTLLDGRRLALRDVVVEGNVVRGVEGERPALSCDIAERARCDSLGVAVVTRVGVADIRAVAPRPDYATPGFLLITLGLLLLGTAAAMNATRSSLELDEDG